MSCDRRCYEAGGMTKDNNCQNCAGHDLWKAQKSFDSSKGPMTLTAFRNYYLSIWETTGVRPKQIALPHAQFMELKSNPRVHRVAVVKNSTIEIDGIIVTREEEKRGQRTACA